MDDDETPKRLTPLLLDRLGVAELERYIVDLQAEIARAQAQIQAKQNHRSAADTLFKF